MLALRDSVPSTQLDYLSSRISERLFELQELKSAKTVATYVSTGSEVRTGAILAWCIAQGKRVIIPVTNRKNRRLSFSQLIHPESELEKGTFGIPEPRPEFLRPIPLEQAEVALVPGIAWDSRGYRIGHGGGYYDRALNSLHSQLPTVGLTYEFQMIDHVPRNRFDRSVNKIVTESRIIDVRAPEYHVAKLRQQ